MIVSESNFVSALCDRLRDGIEAYAALGYVVPIRWPNTTQLKQPDRDKLRITMSYRHTQTRQATLGQPPRFETKGIFTAQVFAPAGVPESAKQLADLADAVRGFYAGVSEPGGVWYRDVTIQQQPASGDWFSARVSGKYAFDRYQI